MPKTLKGAVVAITGAGSGIGRALALQCVQEGAAVALSDVSEQALEETGQLCLAYSKDVACDVVDVSKSDEIYSWAALTADRFGKVNVIINNAGVSLNASMENMSDQDFEWLMQINFWGVIHGTRAFLPHLKQAEWGHIINISSLFGLISMPNQAAYNSAKFAVRGFSESLRIELGIEKSRVRLSCVHPGGVKTNIVNSSKICGIVGAQLSEQQQKNEFNNKLARLTSEQAANIILRGMKKNKGRILVGSDARLFDLLQRLMPEKYQSLVVRIMNLRKSQIEREMQKARVR